MIGLYIFIGICAFILFLLICGLIVNVSNYFDSMREYNRVTTRIEVSRSVIDMSENTLRLLEITRAIISNEISDLMKVEVQTRKPFKLMNTDIALEKIANNTFNALNKDILSNNNLIIDVDYLQIFIIHESLHMLLARIREHNNSLTLM